MLLLDSPVFLVKGVVPEEAPKFCVCGVLPPFVHEDPFHSKDEGYW